MTVEAFTECAQSRGLQDVDTLAGYGKEAIEGVLDVWKSLPPDLKAAIVATVTALGEYAAAAIAAMGVGAAEFLAWIGAAVAVGVGLGVAMDVLEQCMAQW